MHHLNNTKLDNLTVLTATSATAASNRYSDERTFTLTQKILGS